MGRDMIYDAIPVTVRRPRMVPHGDVLRVEMHDVTEYRHEPRFVGQSLEEERAGLNPYKKAFRVALLNVSFPGHLHALDKVEATVTARRLLAPFDPIVVWWEAVTQFIRLHPDVETFRLNPALYVDGQPMTETKVDALFRVAQAIEDGRLDDVAGLVAAFEAEAWN